MTALQRITDTPNLVPTEALIDKRNGKPKPVPRKVRHAIRLIDDGECRTIKAAAQQVGLSREHLSKSLGMPHVQVFIARKSRETISASVLRAALRATELIDAASEHVAAKMCERILTSEGILRSDQAHVSVNANVSVGFVIDLGEPAARARDVTPAPPGGDN